MAAVIASIWLGRVAAVQICHSNYERGRARHPRIPALLRIAQPQERNKATEGKLSHVALEKTPNPSYEQIVQAFSKWAFRPAQLNNQPVAVKMLIGIPL